MLTLVLIVFVIPQVAGFAVASLAVAAQQARGRFALAAAAPAVESIGIILTVVIAARLYGTGVEVDRAPVALVVLLAAGSTGAVALHAGLQAYGAARVGLLVRPARGWRDDQETREAMRRMVRSIPVAACPAVTNYALSAIAATVPGGVLVVQLAYQVYYALSYLGARAVAIAALPGLSASTGDIARFGRAWRRALYFALVASTPPLCLLAAFAVPTADLLANGEMRRGDLITDLAACLVVAAITQLVAGVHDLGRQALFARLDDRGPRIASWAALTATLAAALGTLLIADPGTRLLALVGAILVGEACAAVTVLAVLRRAIRPEPVASWGLVTLNVAAALAMVPILAVARSLLDDTAGDRIATVLLMVGFGLLAVAAFAGVQRLGARRLAPSPP